MSTLDGGRIVIGDRLRAGAGDAVHRGTLARDPSVQLLVTLTGPHGTPAKDLPMVPAVDGIAPLEWVGANGDPALPYADALVERLPAGRAASERAPMPMPALARLGAALARVTAAVHAAGSRVDGIRPELVFLDDDGTFTGIAPRGPRFIASSQQRGPGVRSYHVPYLAPEALAQLKPEPASDVFALCATLFVIGSGWHPFGDLARTTEIVSGILSGKRAAWSGDPAIGDVIAAGLAARAADRPRASDIAARFAALS